MATICLAVVLFWAGAPAAADPSPAVGEYQKYTVVRTVGGHPENLAQIALRALGDDGRAAEVLTLNRGRAEPGGATVPASGTLAAGWVLILPWDAAGQGVEYGPVPDAAPPDAAGYCGTASGRPVSGLSWAQLRLAPESAWFRGKGTGVLVAVLDSGITGASPALAGRVQPGADVSAGDQTAGRADNDCTGHGTALAGVVAAAPQRDAGLVGVAPEAALLPVRIATPAGPDALTAGLRAAVDGRAEVALLGVRTDLADPRVQTALASAVAAGVVVVVPAAAADVPVPPGVLRVAGAGPDGKPVDAYADGAADLIAPGSDVVSLARTGSGQVRANGPEFAAAFVAGTAALIRGAQPDLTPAQVAKRIVDGTDSSGFLDVAAAVRGSGAGSSVLGSAGGVLAAVLIPTLAVVALLLGARRRRTSHVAMTSD
ncbi:S8 family serine peptidase [Actinoplanes sp. NPDC026619]|uniref:S8 family serine peptidase n=1 Tax=Actinoplanes sp. NPDC026619 TaxID=3155798 RepID=UPI00340BD022